MHISGADVARLQVLRLAAARKDGWAALKPGRFANFDRSPACFAGR